MKKKALVLTLVVLSVLTWGGAYGANITISDESATGSGWYGPQEDQEVQPGCITGQVWDLGWLSLGTTFTTHFTMQCGNDNLMGTGVIVPEPTSLLLMGMGCLSLW